MEITRDILSESGLGVDEDGFYQAMEDHRLASGKGSAFADMGNDKTEFYASVFAKLQESGKLSNSGVHYDPYSSFRSPTKLIAILKDDALVESVDVGDEIEFVIDRSPFYIESGGQIGDIGKLTNAPSEDNWEIEVSRTFKPVSGLIVQSGKVLSGKPEVDSNAVAKVDLESRRATMRNHTGTHLVHAALRAVLGEKVHQSGSVVDPERMRFDFNYPKAVSKDDLLKIEALVNQFIDAEYPVIKQEKPLDQAKAEGVTALFGEKYGQIVRTIEVADERGRVSYELCGGTHVDNTAEIGSFYIISESSVAAGIRRIEAVTGPGAYKFARERINQLNSLASFLETTPAEALHKVETLESEIKQARRELEQVRIEAANQSFKQKLDEVREVAGVKVLSAQIPNADVDALRNLADQFRQKHPSGLVVLATVINDKPSLIAAVTPDLIKRGLKAGDLIKKLAQVVGGGGGGRPDMAQAGGKDPEKLAEALSQVDSYIIDNLK